MIPNGLMFPQGNVRALDRVSQRPLPHDLSGVRVQRVDDVVLGGDEQKLPPGFRRLPEKRLSVDVSVDAPVKGGVGMHAVRAFPSKPRHHVVSAAAHIAVIGQDRLRLRRRLGTSSGSNPD